MHVISPNSVVQAGNLICIVKLCFIVTARTEITVADFAESWQRLLLQLKEAGLNILIWKIEDPEEHMYKLTDSETSVLLLL